ncbi:MAG: PD40 domain-containing protein [Deltaproteobacteria bacterium]|nr:PD40 domain-containing protein [Deltaproteobacteria bacterium]
MKKSSLVRFFPVVVVLLIAAPVFSGIAQLTMPNDYATLVSVNSSGNLGNNNSWNPAISADGNHVAFVSSATNLIPIDNNGNTDVFLRNLSTGYTAIISVSSSGSQGYSPSDYPAISADGRYVTFCSLADNLVQNDNNNEADVFLGDTKTGLTMLISKNSAGEQGDDASLYPAISADGRYIAFTSFASNLVPVDINGSADVFLHDTQTGVTSLVSKDSSGSQGNGDSGYPSISADGRYVVFMSVADNLTLSDSNGMADIFLHDVLTGKTSIITQGNGHSGQASISADGRYVAFASNSDNLAPGDANGYTADVFVYDRQTAQTEMITHGSRHSMYPKISGDGRYVAYQCPITNLTACEGLACSNAVAVYDRKTGSTTLLSVLSAEIPGLGDSFSPSISADGHRIVFCSQASNLAYNDYNGAADIILRETPPEETAKEVDSGDGSGGGGCFIRAIF